MTNNSPGSVRSIWLCDLTHSYQTIAMNKMPLGVGMIASYCKKETPCDISISIFKFLDEITDEVKKGYEPLITGFSNYVWNNNLNLEVSKRIKAKYPKSVAVFGGPHFPSDRSEQFNFFKKNFWVDFFIPYEGERAFQCLIKLMLEFDGDIEKVKNSRPMNTIFIKDNELVHGELFPRMELACVPSPYLEGFFDKYFGKLIPMVQTTRGCPFSCAYCYDGLFHWSKITRRDSSLSKELEYIAQRCRPTDHLYITDANFGMYAQDIEVCKTIAELQDAYSWPWFISVNTGKNNKEKIFEAAKITRGAMAVSAALQSTDPIVLQNVKRRNLPSEEIIKLAKDVKELSSSAVSNSDLILCLPGDTTKAHFKSIKDVIDSGIDEIIPFQFMLLPGTELATKESQEKYQMVTKYRVLPRCFGIYEWPDNGEDIIASEIEIICVANNTMSFEDYLDCRTMDLTVAMFYNNSILADLYRILSYLKISVFDFILKLQAEAMKQDMKNLYDEFIKETKEELWDSQEEILEFINEPGVLEKYRRGEYGANLIFKYKTLAYTKFIDFMINIAYAQALEFFGQKEKIAIDNISNIFEFLQELKKFHRSLVVDFLDINKNFVMNFIYNVVEFHEKSLPLNKIKKSKQTFVIEHTPEQKNIIEQSVKSQGENLIGLSQMFSQIPLNKLRRKPMVKKLL